MSYDEFVSSIQAAVESHLSTGNMIFGIILFIAIVTGIVFFALYVRKEYYRKRSEIDDFMLEERHEKDQRCVCPCCQQSEENDRGKRSVRIEAAVYWKEG